MAMASPTGAGQHISGGWCRTACRCTVHPRAGCQCGASVCFFVSCDSKAQKRPHAHDAARAPQPRPTHASTARGGTWAWQRTGRFLQAPDGSLGVEPTWMGPPAAALAKICHIPPGLETRSWCLNVRAFYQRNLVLKYRYWGRSCSQQLG